METKQYLDLEGLKTLVSQIKAEDAKVRSYVDAKVEEIVNTSLTYTNEEATLSAHGGISAGSTFNNVSIQDMLTRILYPYTKCSLTGVSAVHSLSSYSNEKGVEDSITGIKFTVAQKSYPLATVEVHQGSAIGTKVAELTEEQVATITKAGKSFELTFDTPISVSGSSVTLYVVATDTSTESSKSSIGNTSSYSWYYPFYYGASNKKSSELIASDIASMIADGSLVKYSGEATGSKDLKIVTNDQYPCFVCAKAISKIVDTDTKAQPLTDGFEKKSTQVAVSSTSPAWSTNMYVYTYYMKTTTTGFNYYVTF